jgi:hypothetical protein
LEYEVFAARCAFAPVFMNFGKDVLLFPPMKNGKCKGAFGVEYPTFYGFEGRGNAVVVAFIIAGYDPDIAFVFEADLGATGYMSCRMERYFYAVDINGFVVIDALECDGIAEALAHHAFVEVVREVGIHAVTGMVGMGMGNQGPIHGLYRIDEEVADFAVKAGGGLF